MNIYVIAINIKHSYPVHSIANYILETHEQHRP
jgi:hypothetical protein